MIGAGLPKSVVALHSLKTNQDVLHGIVKCMAHVELSRNIRRRNYDCKGFLTFINLRMKIFLIKPVLVDPVFHLLGIVGFFKFFLHNVLPK